MFRLHIPPIFQESENSRKSLVFFKLIWGGIIIITISGIIDCIVLPHNALRWIFISTIYDLASFGLLYLNRKGLRSIASILFLILCITVVFGLAWSGGGIKAPAVLAFPILVLVAGLIIGWKAGILTGIIISLAGLGLVLAEYWGKLPESSVVNNSVSIWVSSVMCILILTVLQFLYVEGLNKVLLEAKNELTLRKNSESRLKSISNNFIAGMIYQVVIKPDGTRKFTYLSDSVQKLYGVSPSEGIANSSLIYGRVHEDDIDLLIKAEEEAIKTFTTFKMESRMKDPSGNIRWSSFVSTPSMMEDGSICFDGIEFIITEHKLAEEALKKSEDNFRSIFEKSSTAYVLTSPEGRLLKVNKAMADMLGYHIDELQRINFQEITYPDDIATSNINFQDHLSGGLEASQFEKRYLHKNGTIIWAFVNTTLIRNSENIPLYFITSITDISKRKLAEEALHKSEERFRLILENMPILLNAFDENGNFIVWNKTCEEVTGYLADEIIGNPKALEMLYPDPEYRAKVWNSSLDPKNKFNVFDMVTKNGEVRTIEWFDIYHQLKIPGWTSWGLGQDITERKKAEEAMRESEFRNRMVSELATDYVYKLGVSQDGKISLLFVSDSFYSITGRAKEEIATIEGWSNIIHPDDLGKVMEFLYRLIANNQSAEIECRSYVHGNQLRWVHIVTRSEWNDKENRVTAIVGAVKDITKRKLTEEALKVSESNLQALINNRNESIWSLDLNYNLIICNDYFRNAYFAAYNIDLQVGINLIKILSPELKSYWKPKYDAALSGEKVTFEFTETIQGTKYYFSVFLNPIISDGKITGVSALSMDISEIKKAEEALRESEERIKTISSMASEGLMIQENGIILDLNHAFARIVGYSNPDELVGKNGLEVIQFTSESKQKVLEHIRINSSESYDVEIVNREGKIIPAETRGTNILYKERKARLVYMRDITERKLAEKEVKESEELFKNLIRNAPYPIVLSDMEDRFVLANMAFCELNKVTEMDTLGKTVSEIGIKVDKKTEEILKKEMISKKKVDNFEISAITLDGRKLQILFSSRIIQWNNKLFNLTSIINITEQKNIERELEKYRDHLEYLVKERTEELNTTNEELSNQKEELQSTLNALSTAQNQLIHSEKMASLGVLSAGIAHEINNPLNFIHGGILGIETYFNDYIPEHITNVYQMVNAINTGVKRASDIVSSLSHYSSRDDLPKTGCDLHSIIDNCLIMLQNQLKNKVEISKFYTKKPHQVIGNEGKLHQAILNIIANAEQSIETIGKIIIITDVIKDFLVVKINDNGCGISKENIQKIFDPFFTTKAPGKGIGLGLSITYNIVKEHNGTIDFESQLGKGTIATINLPVDIL